MFLWEDIHTVDNIGRQERCQIWYPNWVRLAPNGTNLGFFFNQFQYILAETDIKKSQICYLPIWLNLDAKFDIPGYQMCKPGSLIRKRTDLD